MQALKSLRSAPCKSNSNISLLSPVLPVFQWIRFNPRKMSFQKATTSFPCASSGSHAILQVKANLYEQFLLDKHFPTVNQLFFPDFQDWPRYPQLPISSACNFCPVPSTKVIRDLILALCRLFLLWCQLRNAPHNQGYCIFKLQSAAALQ